jgi:glucose/arabinose dehydrogenase
MNALRRAVPLLFACAVPLLAPACSTRHSTLTGPVGTPVLALATVTTGLTFPTFLTSPPGDATRLFVTEKHGKIRVLENRTLLPAPFLDLTSLVRSTGDEQGLLGLAFEPGFARTGRFLVSYTDSNDAVRIVRYRADVNADIADPTPIGTVLTIPKSDPSHNGGEIAFGPDGMLWIGVGDGGGAGDPYHTGQSKADLFGSLLRIDVSRGDSGYTIPAGNPFASPDRPEVWNTGLRNPWRFSFDRETGDLYIGDVGQNRLEEIDVASSASGRAPGADYGWPILEGDECYDAGTCSRAGMVAPVITWPHGPGCAVTGGYVYRGRRLPGLRGTYFYSDYCGHVVHSFRLTGGVPTEATTWTALDPGSFVPSFGEDSQGELYVLTDTGGIYQIVAG